MYQNACVTLLSPDDYGHNIYIYIFQGQILYFYSLQDNEALSEMWLLELPPNKDFICKITLVTVDLI